jgi:TPR repeat protein
LGQLQANGQGFTQDLSAARENFEKAASKGEGEAYNFLAQMYESGKGVKQSLQDAVENYENAAKLDSVTSMLKLGNIYANGVKDGDKELIKPDLAKAKSYLQTAAAKEVDKKHGTTGTMNLAAFYELYEKKPEDALAAYKKAAEIGDYNAMVKVGNMLTDGQGTTKDPEAAFKSYLASTAETESGKLSGSPAGMMAVSISYEKGTGVKADPAKAKQWLMYSALGGYAPAMRQLGVNYKEGKSALKDIVASITWLQKALAAGDAESAMVLSEMLEKGESDLPQDFRQSNALLTKVAEAGSPEAQLRLANNNYEGKGTSKDVIRAYALLLAAGDYEPAKKKRDEMVKSLTKEQIAEANKEVDRMRNKPSAAVAPADAKGADKAK